MCPDRQIKKPRQNLRSKEGGVHRDESRMDKGVDTLADQPGSELACYHQGRKADEQQHGEKHYVCAFRIVSDEELGLLA
jgi:hypothetical protein